MRAHARNRPYLAASVLALLAAPTIGAAQLATVRGIAWDSLRAEPLPGAFISVLGTGRTGTADARGRFQIDSVPIGSHTMLMSHDALDSLGITGVSAKIAVADGRGEVRLSVPSFAAFWKTGCDGRPPRDSSLVYGVVRHAGGPSMAIAHATVELAWLDVGVKGRRDVQQVMKKLETTTDSVGNYGFCGVPNGSAFRVRATVDGAASGIIDMLPNTDRVRWRDLAIAPAVGSLGNVVGSVVRGTGTPFPDARVAIEGGGETRTDSAGRFVLTGVPAGTQQLEIQAVGIEPVLRAVDVGVGDTVRAYVNLDRITRLGSVRVSATPFTDRLTRSLVERRAQGIGYFFDSTEFVGRPPWIASALAGLPHLEVRDSMPSGGIRGSRPVKTIRMRAGCTPIVFLDGITQTGYEPIWALSTDEVALVELYPSKVLMPTEFQSNVRANCAIAIWTKRAVRRS